MRLWFATLANIWAIVETLLGNEQLVPGCAFRPNLTEYVLAVLNLELQLGIVAS